MKVLVSSGTEAMGQAAAQKGIELLNKAISERGEAVIIVATGASQFTMLEELVQSGLDWSKVSAFHLDEYLGLPDSHPASFRRYLRERFVGRVNLKAFHPISGEGDPIEECRRLGQLIAGVRVDVAFIGIGENGHLAFNDPPADFHTPEAFLVVELDEACRKQQWGEGWFPSLEAVPQKAISMSIPRIMQSEAIICTVPDERKAEAVRQAVEGEIGPQLPASILRKHDQCWIYLDQEAASLLS